MFLTSVCFCFVLMFFFGKSSCNIFLVVDLYLNCFQFYFTFGFAFVMLKSYCLKNDQNICLIVAQLLLIVFFLTVLVDSL